MLSSERVVILWMWLLFILTSKDMIWSVVRDVPASDTLVTLVNPSDNTSGSEPGGHNEKINMASDR